MEAKNIKSLKDAERFVEGCMNDFETGISTKEETMKYFFDYTIRIVEIAKPTHEVRDGCYQPTVDNTTTPPSGDNNHRERLEAAFDAGWDCSVMHNCGICEGAFEDFDKWFKEKGQSLFPDIPQLSSQQNLKLRSNAIELLDAYSKFLEKNGYLDADWNMEEPYAIDQFLAKNPDLFKQNNVKMISIEDVKKKLLDLHPQIKSDKYTNPFLYRDIRDWYNELSK